MSENKLGIIQRTVSQFKRLPPDKKMFVLGIMQGILINQPEKKEPDVSREKARKD